MKISSRRISWRGSELPLDQAGGRKYSDIETQKQVPVKYRVYTCYVLDTVLSASILGECRLFWYLSLIAALNENS